jgi:chromosome segregation ATPase
VLRRNEWNNVYAERDQYMESNVKLAAEIERLAAEIEWLRAEVGDRRHAAKSGAAQIEEQARVIQTMTAEIERLRQANERLRAVEAAWLRGDLRSV